MCTYTHILYIPTRVCMYVCHMHNIPLNNTLELKQDTHIYVYIGMSIYVSCMCTYAYYIYIYIYIYTHTHTSVTTATVVVRAVCGGERA